MRRPRLVLLSALALFLLFTAACSLLLDKSTTQCSTDADCVSSFGAGTSCVANLCVSGSAAQDGASPDALGSGDSTLVDGNTSDGTNVVPFDGGFDGCFQGQPTNQDQLLNACTAAECVRFDNCAMLGLCDDSGVPDPTFPDAAGAAASSLDGSASELCYDPANGRANVVYVTGSTNLPTFLSAVAPLLAADNPAYTIVWQASNSCNGVNTVFNNMDGTKRMISDGAGKQTVYYDATGNPIPCLLNGPVQVDVGESDIFSSSCSTKLGYTPDPAPNNVGEYLGPIQAMTFLVPEASSQRAISAEAAHVVYGLGGLVDGGAIEGGIPWNDPNYQFNRADSTGTNQILSRAISITPSQWWGTQKSSASAMAQQLLAVPAGATEKTIGTISADVADQQRGNLRELAFQSFGQQCAFWADSTQFTKDKINVRDGHYPIWGPLHFFTALQGTQPTPAAGAFVLRFAQPKLDQALVQAIAQSGNVPACAMKVKRTSEMGPLVPGDPPYSCGCFFDSVVTGKSSCKTCMTNTECTDPAHPTCNYGFCETGN